MFTPSGTPINARAMLHAAWPLFQLSWTRGLPLAVLGVAASGMPSAESVRTGESHGFSHSPEWWGLYAACIALMLICYGAMLLLQISVASGQETTVREALRASVLRLPAAAATVLLAILAVAAGTALLVVPGILALLYLGFSWHVVLRERTGVLASLARSVALVRGRVLALAGVLGAAGAGVLVFVLLTGILMGLVMSLAAIDPRAGGLGLGFARLLYAVVLAVPVVWLGAVSTVTYFSVCGLDLHTTRRSGVP
jgi:hypothetical protein